MRNGGVVDSEDLSRGWLVSRLLGRGGASIDEEERPVLDGDDGHSRTLSRGGGQWGANGISVSADEGVLDSTKYQKNRGDFGASRAGGNELSGNFEDGEDIDDGVQSSGTLEVVSNIEAWRDQRGK